MRNPPPEHTKWKPGQSGNILGKPKLLLTKDSLRKLLDKFSKMKVKQLREFLTDDNAEVLEVMVASIMIKAIEQGDYTRLDGLLSRHLGKVKDEIEQTIKTVEDEDLDTIPRDLLLKLASSDK